MKKKIIGIIFVLLTNTLITGCTSQKSPQESPKSTITKPIDTNLSNKTVVVNLFNVKKMELPSGLFFDGSIKSDILIGKKKDLKNIYSYNIKDGKVNKITSNYNTNNFIKTVVSNTQWIVWIENEILIDDTSNKPFQWQMIAQNISTGKRKIIDKSSFTS